MGFRTTPPAAGGRGSASPQSQNATTTTSAELKEKPSEAAKTTKRRAARACVSCRARKVRCDVVEGAPCGNCRWDNVKCVVQESRRRRRHLLPAATSSVGQSELAEAPARPLDARKANCANSASPSNEDADRAFDGAFLPSAESNRASSRHLSEDHVPHLIYKFSGYDGVSVAVKPQSAVPTGTIASDSSRTLMHQAQSTQFRSTLQAGDEFGQLPPFIKPLPHRLAGEDVAYLCAKGACTLPSLPVQNALLRAYVEYVHPYMPLLDLHAFLDTIHHGDGLCGQTSLLLYHAVMFSATTFVDAKYIRQAGFASRRAARRAFFQRTRLLYDFDYETDRLVLVQALLLMTYWYETPDDQKDTWHWMGVAISLAHTIGLHRNPANTNMPLGRQKLLKRVWWSCFMRDRLVALGMRRPTRIKDEDFDVPMLDEADFDIEALSDENQLLPPECTVIRNVAQQNELATMCVRKAKLCMILGHLLKTQYAMLNRDNIRPDDTTNSTMMLFPNKGLESSGAVAHIDAELALWYSSLPTCCQYRPLTELDVENGRASISLQRTLLHMVYQTAISTLHRPQFLTSSPLQLHTVARETQEMARLRVREAARQVTAMAADLQRFRLQRYLPTIGVTVILPATIMHLLDMKSQADAVREDAMAGFVECFEVLDKLREVYAAADFAVGFLQAALRRASIDIGSILAGRRALRGLDDERSNGLSLAALDFDPRTVHVAEPSTPPPEAVELTAPSALAGELIDPLLTMSADGQRRGFDWMVIPSRGGMEQNLAAGMTPSASGSSDVSQGDMDVGGGGEDFSWADAAGTANLDLDEWLSFPGEGFGNSDESFGEFLGDSDRMMEDEAQRLSDMTLLQASV